MFQTAMNLGCRFPSPFRLQALVALAAMAGPLPAQAGFWGGGLLKGFLFPPENQNGNGKITIFKWEIHLQMVSFSIVMLVFCARKWADSIELIQCCSGKLT